MSGLSSKPSGSASQSSVGDRRAYQADDKVNHSKEERQEAERYKEGKENSHYAQDSKDERSIANKLAREEKREKESEEEKDFETVQQKKDPTLPAASHGNEPSKGAKIDKEIQEEEEEMLKKKGTFGPK